MDLGDGKVVRLVDRAQGVPVDDGADLIAWLRGWADSLEAGEYGGLRTLVLVVENDKGQLASIAQKPGKLSGYERIGLLFRIAHMHADGQGDIRSLYVEPEDRRK